jgi:hypothetical protein
VIPGLRFRAVSAEGSGIDGVGRRDWIRVYRFDAFWDARRTLRGWLRVRHRHTPARRIYDDSDSFDFACQETSGEEGPSIHKDNRGYYCVEPATHETSPAFCAVHRSPPAGRHGRAFSMCVRPSTSRCPSAIRLAQET